MSASSPKPSRHSCFHSGCCLCPAKSSVTLLRFFKFLKKLADDFPGRCSKSISTPFPSNVQGRNLYCTWTADSLFVNDAFPTVSESSKTHSLTLANYLLFRSSTSHSCVHLASSLLLLRQLLSPTFDKINKDGAPDSERTAAILNRTVYTGSMRSAAKGSRHGKRSKAHDRFGKFTANQTGSQFLQSQRLPSDCQDRRSDTVAPKIC